MSTSASGEKIFNLSDGINYYNENKEEIMSSTPSSNNDYDNHSNAEENTGSTEFGDSSNGKSGGGGCNGFTFGLITMIIFVPLAKKFKR